MKMNHHFNVWDNVAGIHGSIAALTRLFLSSLQGFKSTDARDQVVALVGILGRLADNYEKQPIPVTANYKKATAEVYTEVMTYLLQHLGLLTSLSKVQSTRMTTDEGLPSWAIDHTSCDSKAVLDLQEVPASSRRQGFDASEGIKIGFSYLALAYFCIVSNKVPSRMLANQGVPSKKQVASRRRLK